MMLIVAVVAIVRPVVIVRWAKRAKRAHPELSEDDESALWIARLVGIEGLGVTAFFWIIVIRSLLL
jgi:hypothetical protein